MSDDYLGMAVTETAGRDIGVTPEMIAAGWAVLSHAEFWGAEDWDEVMIGIYVAMIKAKP